MEKHVNQKIEQYQLKFKNGCKRIMPVLSTIKIKRRYLMANFCNSFTTIMACK